MWFRIWMSVFVLVCVIPLTASLPNSILTFRVASWWKTQRIAAIKPGNELWSEFANSTRSKKPKAIYLKSSMTRGILKMRINQLINLQCKARCLPLPFVLMTVECLQNWQPMWAQSLMRRGGRDNIWIWTAIPFQQLAVNITYCTFNILCCNHPFSSDGPSGKACLLVSDW